MLRLCSLKTRVCIVVCISMLFLWYSWVTFCHKPTAAASAVFICGYDSVFVKSRQGHSPVGDLVQESNVSSQKAKMRGTPRSFQVALSLYANSNRVIFLSLMDMGCLDMAINLYLSSYKKLGMTHYIFLSSDQKSCPEMLNLFPDVHCIHYADDQDAERPSSYGSKSFIRKTYLKSKAVQEALLLDYNVLLMDIDIVLLKDPLPYFEGDYDLQIQWDHGSVCSGFYFIRATSGGKLFMEKVWKLAESGSFKQREQSTFQKAVNGLKGHKGFKHRILPEKDFPNGHAYYHGNKIMFTTDGRYPPTSYLVHGNWIISQAAKIYRFKETSMWYYDKNGYYSNLDAKYLMYQDKFPKSFRTRDLEAEALKAALLMGHMLQRIVILPSFSCYGCNAKKFTACKVKREECAFITGFKVEQFDKFFEGLYREHMFLHSDMVPVSVKHSKSNVLTPDTFDGIQGGDQKGKLMFPISDFKTVEDVSSWLSKYDNVSVLVMDHLQTAWTVLSHKFLDNDMDKKLKSALKKSNYLQE